MGRLGMPVSDTTILAGLRRNARAQSESCAGAAVHLVGVDDWAWRKINKLKILKRAIYSRAGVNLLRARMMPF